MKRNAVPHVVFVLIIILISPLSPVGLRPAMAQGSGEVLLYDHFDVDGDLDSSLWQFGTNSTNGDWSISDSILTLSSGIQHGGGAYVDSQQLFTLGVGTLTLETYAAVSSADGGNWGFFENDGGLMSFVGFSLDPDTGNLRAWTYTDAGNITHVDIPGIDATTWHTYHVQITENAAIFYVDGELKATLTEDVPLGKPMSVRLDRVSWGVNQTLSVDSVELISGTSTIPSFIAAADSADLYPGDSTSVVLNIEDADDLYAAQALCTVDPIILEPQSAIFGDFFDLVNRFIAANTVDAGAGTWFGAISQQNPAGPLSGDGHYATITYQALSPGTSTVTCNPLFSNRDGFTQTVTFVTDTVTVLPFATITGTATYQGRLDHTGIAVAATGAVTSTDTTDSAGDFTLGQLRAYTYTVRADAGSYLPACSTVSVTPGETVILSATTLLGGDLNDDDTINIADATLLGSNFGLSVPPAAAQADINADGVVNVQDLAILAGNYDVSGCQDW